MFEFYILYENQILKFYKKIRTKFKKYKIKYKMKKQKLNYDAKKIPPPK